MKREKKIRSGTIPSPFGLIIPLGLLTRKLPAPGHPRDSKPLFVAVHCRPVGLNLAGPRLRPIDASIADAVIFFGLATNLHNLLPAPSSHCSSYHQGSCSGHCCPAARRELVADAVCSHPGALLTSTIPPRQGGAPSPLNKTGCPVRPGNTSQP